MIRYDCGFQTGKLYVTSHPTRIYRCVSRVREGKAKGYHLYEGDTFFKVYLLYKKFVEQ